MGALFCLFVVAAAVSLHLEKTRSGSSVRSQKMAGVRTLLIPQWGKFA